MRKVIFILASLALYIPQLSGQDWIVPDNRKTRLSPFGFTDETHKAGEKIYITNCLSCHGNPGRGNVINLVPPPPDPVSEKVQKNFDGELYYKVAEGRNQMPSFKNVLTSTEIWNLISYIRSFNKSYKQEIMPVITSSAYPGAEIKIRMSYLPADTAIILTALAVKGNSSEPVTNAEIRLFAFRTFGQLPLGEAQTTDNNGIAKFPLPEYLPGDTTGNIKLSARFSDEEAFGAFSRDTILNAGMKILPISLTAKRAMWNTARMAPVWIILTFLGGLLTVWAFIFLILLKIRDVYIIGETLDERNKNSGN